MVPAPSQLETDLSTLGLVCLAHLEQEEAMLGETIASLRKVRQALVGGDLNALGEALEMQAHTARAAEELRGRRERLRRDAAARLGMPAHALTLERLLEKLPDASSKKVAACRSRLIAMAGEVDRLNRANARLIRSSLEFLHQILVQITGGDASGTPYHANGTRAESSCGSLIEARG